MFTSTEATLCRVPDSMLARAVQSRATMDAQHNVFIDRDPEFFPDILVSCSAQRGVWGVGGWGMKL